MSLNRAIAQELANARKSLEKGDLQEADYDDFVSERISDVRLKYLENDHWKKLYEGRTVVVKRGD